VVKQNKSSWIDLRSDTVTQPTAAMREAMATAVVGDDVYGEDPTINRFEKMAAARVGKEAALFIPSGTMGNLAAVLTHCSRGDEVILGTLAHTFLFEAGGIAALGGVHPHTLPNQEDGTLRIDHIENAIRAKDPHYPVTRLICLENTHNRCGGVALSAEYMWRVREIADRHDLQLHLDGARIFNAAVAEGVDAKELAAPADSIMFCISKGLCAPVGSVLCGSQEFVAQARRIRKQLGGGMRQAGILAAAGIVALEEIVPRLAEDHRHARQLAAGIAGLPGIQVEKDPPPSNMVFLQLENHIPMDASQLAEKLAEENLRVGAVSSRRIRMVFHYWISDEDVNLAIAAFKKTLAEL
jgi:threonine aldolase